MESFGASHPGTTSVECTLGSEDLPKRGANMASLASQSLLDVQTDGARAQLRFRPGESARADIDAFVAAESKCCAFFEFDVDESDGEIVLSIKAPAEGAWATRRLVAGFVSGWEVRR